MHATSDAAHARLGAIPTKLSAWMPLVGLLMLGAGLRLAFFNGAFGSDDLVYLNRSVQIAEGSWSSANYNGALRYGFNIPAGFFMYLFGVNMLTANLWPFLCSLGEIGAVYVLARSLWGRQAALYAGLILVFMPLHVASATRIHADPVVAFFLTLSFVCFFFAEQNRSRTLYFLTGIAMGLVFWAKELAGVTLFAFVFYPFLWRKLDPRWVYVGGGGMFMLLAHFALMGWVAGDPLHAFKVVLGQVSRSFIGGGDAAEDGAWYYLRYLFVDIKHIWLAGIIAAAAVVGEFLSRRRRSGAGTAYVIFWLLALFGVLSFMPVSLTPLKLVMKQSNYLTLFLAPVALMAGYQIALLPRRAALAILLTTLAGGFILAGLEQQAYRVFTSNSKAAVEFSRAHPGVPLVGSNNNGNIAAIYGILDRNAQPAIDFRYMSDVPRHAAGDAAHPAMPVYAVHDRETMGWGKNALTLEQAPSCWMPVAVLVPTGFGLGQSLISILQAGVGLLPAVIHQRLIGPLEKLAHPLPAVVYRADLSNFWCEQGNAQH